MCVHVFRLATRLKVLNSQRAFIDHKCSAQMLTVSSKMHEALQEAGKCTVSYIGYACMLCLSSDLYHSSHIVQRYQLQCISQKTADQSCKLSHILGGKNSYTTLSPYMSCGQSYTMLLWYKPVIPLPLRGLTDTLVRLFMVVV